MKLLVFSDSHNDVATMLSVVKAEQPEAVLHLGDHFEDGLELRSRIQAATYLVAGNTDQGQGSSTTALLTFDQTKIFMTHGHVFGVKESLSDLLNAGSGLGAYIVLYGHTHKPYLSFTDGLWVMNPGCIGRRSSKAIHATYGLILLDNRRIRCGISEVTGDR
jgi:putative phosphoesterase